MNMRATITALALFGCMGVITLNTQAADSPDKTVQPSNTNVRDLQIGDRAPSMFQRTNAALNDWQQKGLRAPEKESQWVRMNDKYVMVQITNGRIIEITPVKK